MKLKITDKVTLYCIQMQLNNDFNETRDFVDLAYVYFGW